MAIKMTTSHKFEYKAKRYGKQWDPMTSITAYFSGLNKFRTSLADRSITTSIEEMTMAVGTRMRESKVFTKDQMVAGENKTSVQQTWQNLQYYFTKKWLEQRQYSQATTKHSRFRDAALAAQELAAAEEEGETTTMMCALLRDQQKAQLEAMVAANKQAMDANGGAHECAHCRPRQGSGQGHCHDPQQKHRPSIHHKPQDESMQKLRKARLSQTANLL
jgi:hypothetical protein